MRKIIHIDMDAFYASVEQRDNPELRGKPVAVGGNKNRGVVAAASYEARKFGVHSALPSITAARRCPDLIFVKPRFEVYRSVSRAIREIFYEYTDLVEPLSLDEAYLDVTENKQQIAYATKIGRSIKHKIRQQTGLTASAGISYNKFLAKIASDYEKPDGFYVILPEHAEAFIEKLPVKKFHGIGKVTAEKMSNLNIHTGGDLRKLPRTQLTEYFGKMGAYYYQISRGIDEREVRPNRQRKSVSAERTFDQDVTSREEALNQLSAINQEVSRRIEKAGFQGRTFTIKIKYFDFVQITRSKTLPQVIVEPELMDTLAAELLTEEIMERGSIRLLGSGISHLVVDREGQQLEFDF